MHEDRDVTTSTSTQGCLFDLALTRISILVFLFPTNNVIRLKNLNSLAGMRCRIHAGIYNFRPCGEGTEQLRQQLWSEQNGVVAICATQSTND